jgi:alkanesulfonate monooxygenase SsuD/methylene tetrahydromethanopterin reductase-like flavin-dependent oxidoreductase (luciferase family)
MTNLRHLQDKETKFGATSRPGNPVELAKWVKVAEMLGFDRIGIADSPALYRDVWISSVHVAHATNVIPFGPWVTNPISRHPVVTASAALSLNELAPGRACVGIGTGNSGVYNLGEEIIHRKPFKTVCRSAAVAISIRLCSVLWKGMPLEMGAQTPENPHIHGSSREQDVGPSRSTR